MLRLQTFGNVLVRIVDFRGLPMITMMIVVKVKPEKREEFLQAMRSLNSDGEQLEGLREFKLNQENENPTGFSLIY
jgi:quinol monooxygenase YgiN